MSAGSKVVPKLVCTQNEKKSDAIRQTNREVCWILKDIDTLMQRSSPSRRRERKK
jgi:hypothetical protein